jgi:sterol desaturase/sphingolipid hydroxylase (fatty acid hydroxylase superfamily)
MRRQFLYHFPQGIVWIVVSGINLWIVYFIDPATPTQSLLTYGMGSGVLWSLEEYVFHRYALHYDILYTMYHGIHHTRWIQLSTLFKPQWLIVASMGIQYQLCLYICGLLAASKLFVWLPLYYLLFEWLHYSTHYTGPRWMNQIRDYHRAHHIEESLNYGITTPMWDWVFGTLHPDFVFTSRDMFIGLFPLLWFIRALLLDKKRNRDH